MMMVRLLHPLAKEPKRGSEGAAGYDLYSIEEKTIASKDRGLVDLGISLAIPAGFYGRVASRSGLSVRHGIEVGAGVIDSDYRGPVKVMLHNHGPDDYTIGIGERIAQLIITPVAFPGFIYETPDKTSRGAGGFGSTGSH